MDKCECIIISVRLSKLQLCQFLFLKQIPVHLNTFLVGMIATERYAHTLIIISVVLEVTLVFMKREMYSPTSIKNVKM